MTPEEVENLSKSFRCCFMAEGGCIECPRNKDEDDYCAIHLREDILEALKRLKFLETPTWQEQPELPGIGDNLYDRNAFYDFMTEKGNTISVRVRNALMRAGCQSIAVFAETNVEELIKVRNIGMISWEFLIKKHNEAMKMMGMEPVVPDMMKLALMLGEKVNPKIGPKLSFS